MCLSLSTQESSPTLLNKSKKKKKKKKRKKLHITSESFAFPKKASKSINPSPHRSYQLATKNLKSFIEKKKKKKKKERIF